MSQEITVAFGGTDITIEVGESTAAAAASAAAAAASAATAEAALASIIADPDVSALGTTAVVNLNDRVVVYRAGTPLLFNGVIPRIGSGGAMSVGDSTVMNSALPGLGLSRNITSSALNYHGFADSSQLTFSLDVAYNSFDAFPNILGAGLMNHYAGYQSRPVKDGAGTLTNYFAYHADILINAGTVENYYALFVQDPEANGGDPPDRIVGLLFNGIPRDYGDVGNPNYLYYSNGLAPAFMAGQQTAGTIVASASEITGGAMIHANTPDGTLCGIRIQQQSQNWWEWRMPASASYLSLFNAPGGGTEVARFTSGNKMMFPQGLVNAANDAAAAGAGVAVNELYRNGSVVMIRVA